MSLNTLTEPLNAGLSSLTAPILAAQDGTLQGLMDSAGIESIELNNDFIVGWGTLSLINAGLAQGKGRSGLAWFLVSLLLGPIATFLIVALDRVEE